MGLLSDLNSLGWRRLLGWLFLALWFLAGMVGGVRECEKGHYEPCTYPKNLLGQMDYGFQKIRYGRVVTHCYSCQSECYPSEDVFEVCGQEKRICGKD